MTQLGTKKSRRGCKRCKNRRVKCDEGAPCNNCIRRNEECSLLEPSPSTSEPYVDTALPTNADEWIEDLALLHHYTISTALETRGLRPALHALWRDYIPQQATKHKFLMHGLLALSALHLASLDPDEAVKYARLCDKHQTIALAKYRSILATEIDMESADALFAFASTLSLSSMARSCSPFMTRDTQFIDVDAVVELFYLTRGVRDVIALCYQHLKAGPMSEMFHGHSYPEETTVTLPETVVAHFKELEAMLQNSELDQQATKDCQSALTYLEDIYRNIVYFAELGPIEVWNAWRWSVEISTAFLRLVTARVPAALIIMAHFAAATAAMQTTWYTENWGMYVLHGIALEIDPQHRHWLDWPIEHGRQHMQIMGVTLLPKDSTRKPLIGH